MAAKKAAEKAAKQAAEGGARAAAAPPKPAAPTPEPDMAGAAEEDGPLAEAAAAVAALAGAKLRRSMEPGEPQKWVQCSQCEQWRKVSDGPAAMSLPMPRGA
jgi:hypothetical protein